MGGGRERQRGPAAQPGSELGRCSLPRARAGRAGLGWIWQQSATSSFQIKHRQLRKKRKFWGGGGGGGGGASLCRAVPCPAPPRQAREGGRGRRKRAYQRDGGDEGVRCGEGEEGGVLPVGRLVDVVPPAAESRRRRGGRRGGGGAGGGGEGGGELPHLVRGQGNGGRRRRRRSSSRYRSSSLLPISPPLHRFGVREEGTRRGRKGSHEGGGPTRQCAIWPCAIWPCSCTPGRVGPRGSQIPYSLLYYANK
jgi:hypothetical protein